MLPIGATVRFVRDAREGEGPLAGLLRGLEAASTELALVAGGDMPDLSTAVLLEMLRVAGEAPVDAVALQDGDRFRPLPSLRAGRSRRATPRTRCCTRGNAPSARCWTRSASPSSTSRRGRAGPRPRHALRHRRACRSGVADRRADGVGSSPCRTTRSGSATSRCSRYARGGRRSRSRMKRPGQDVDWPAERAAYPWAFDGDDALAVARARVPRCGRPPATCSSTPASARSARTRRGPSDARRARGRGSTSAPCATSC